MAFDRKFMANMGVSLTSGFVPTPWSYKLSTDTLATIKAANYFDDFKDQLAISDTIYIVGSNGQEIVVVTAISPNVTVVNLVNTQSHIIIAQKRQPTIGGSATENFGVTGVIATDDVYIQMRVEGATPVTVLKANTSTDAVTVVFSADPIGDHEIVILVVRAV